MRRCFRRVTNSASAALIVSRFVLTVGDKVYKRKTKAKGALSFEAPIKPAAPPL
jgi:hypothetical protein